MSKNNSTEVEENIKAGISINNYSEEKIGWSSVPLVPDFAAIKGNWISVQRGTLELEKRYTNENTSSSCIHIRSIDQGATRLGGYSSVHATDGGSPFSQALFIEKPFDINSVFIKRLGSKLHTSQKMKLFDENLRVWETS